MKFPEEVAGGSPGPTTFLRRYRRCLTPGVVWNGRAAGWRALSNNLLIWGTACLAYNLNSNLFIMLKLSVTPSSVSSRTLVEALTCFTPNISRDYYLSGSLKNRGDGAPDRLDSTFVVIILAARL